MPIDPQTLMRRPFPRVEQTYTSRDSILYALGVGLGADPLDPGQLDYVYEGRSTGQKVLPTQVNILGYCGFWADQPDTGITWRKLVHAEQSIVLHQPLASAGAVIGENSVVGLHDKGREKGALMLQERRVLDADSGALLATVTQTTLLRGDGGFGGAYGQPLPAPHVMPDRTADAVCDLPTPTNAALLYRLNGDFNPLHADPDVSAAAGFPRPILHGLATMGVALHAVLRTLLHYNAHAVRAMRVRFTAPVFPGDTLRTELWRDGNLISLRTTAIERGVLVLNAGRVDVS